jgi:ring-1,2-phenylacetyl-CoA epoxidase subunit PaaE
MSTAPQFHSLTVSRVEVETDDAVTVTFQIPLELRSAFAFQAGQYLTLRTTLDGQDVRRSYSICSAPSLLRDHGEVQVGIRAVTGGVFSNWALKQLKAGQALQVMTPQGRFCVQRERAIHRVGFASGSGITPILSIIQDTLESQPHSKFTLVYGNRRMSSVMFNESLQDLKDKYPSRLTLIHILSRQAQEVPLLEGRITGDKVRDIMQAFLPVKSMDEVFICGPEEMIDATEAALVDAGVPKERVYTERFGTGAPTPAPSALRAHNAGAPCSTQTIALRVLLDGKPYDMNMGANEHVLDVALSHGLDLPYSCKGGVCCTCRAKVMEGTVEMSKNFTLEPWEMAQGFVLSCQARATSERVVVSFDER